MPNFHFLDDTALAKNSWLEMTLPQTTSPQPKTLLWEIISPPVLENNFSPKH